MICMMKEPFHTCRQVGDFGYSTQCSFPARLWPLGDHMLVNVLVSLCVNLSRYQLQKNIELWYDTRMITNRTDITLI